MEPCSPAISVENNMPVSEPMKTRERKAVQRPTEIIAECPIGATCTGKIEKSKQWRSCGHYDGTIRDRRGLRVVCTFMGR